jgi:hypothetical protein
MRLNSESILKRQSDDPPRFTTLDGGDRSGVALFVNPPSTSPPDLQRRVTLRDADVKRRFTRKPWLPDLAHARSSAPATTINGNHR